MTNNQIPTSNLLEKLQNLRNQLNKLETVEAEKIRQSRLAVGMGDDFRENEAAKVVMDDHNLLHLRILNLKKEILEIKKRLHEGSL